MTKNPKPTLYGYELTPQELERIKAEIELFDSIEHVTPEMRALIEGQWPHLLAKIKPAQTHPRRPRGSRRGGSR